LGGEPQSSDIPCLKCSFYQNYIRHSPITRRHLLLRPMRLLINYLLH
jgi:hypothetical protein